MRRSAAVACAATLAVWLGSCSPPKDKAVAARSAGEHHRRYNNYSFSEIYDAGHPGLKKLMPKEAFLAGMKAMREGQGAVVAAKEIAEAYNYSPEGNMIKLRYEVTYEKGKAGEEFIWLIADGKAQLSSYRFIMP